MDQSRSVAVVFTFATRAAAEAATTAVVGVPGVISIRLDRHTETLTVDVDDSDPFALALATDVVEKVDPMMRRRFAPADVDRLFDRRLQNQGES